MSTGVISSEVVPSKTAAERVYCMGCGEEIMTESGQLCQKCQKRIKD